ncbi:MAG TPA: ion channel [Halomicronema sp.]
MKKQNPIPRMGLRTLQNNVIRIGSFPRHWSDLYHFLIIISWPKFFIVLALSYSIVNTLFAFAYLGGGNCIENAKVGSFQDAFFFSVQTMATIGYGSMYPKTLYAHVLVTIEAFVGLLGVAMATGILFARFSIPTAKVLFSRVAIITEYNGISTFMFRAANQRNSFILQSQIRVTLLRNEITKEGYIMRRFYDLPLVRNESPIFALSWVVMHTIDENSLLYNSTQVSLAEAETEIIVTFTGLDESVSQNIHTRHSFSSEDILYNKRFVDIIKRLENGQRVIDYRRFHDVEPT